MGLRRAFLLCLTALAARSIRAERVSFHNAHPLGWMHQLPVGESPGWSQPFWFNLEAGQANVWNKAANFTNLSTNAKLSYQADYEQSTVVADLGFSLGERWAFGVEALYANRNGGFMDATIDQFHILVGADRFLRNRFGEFGNTFSVKDGGVERLATTHAEGLGSVKAKLKYWLAKWEGPNPGACACGIATSVQAKVPTQRRELGLTTSHVDLSALVHLGVPIGQDSGVWLTAAYTRLGANDVFAAWPLIRDQRMLELHGDLGLYKHLGLVLTLRTESPLVDPHHLRFDPYSVGATSIKFERISTGWNALTQWRGSEGFGLRWRWGRGQQFNVIMTEDFGLGDQDGTGNAFYSLNAPDVAFTSQLHLSF